MTQSRPTSSLQDRIRRIQGDGAKPQQPPKPWIISGWVVFGLMWVVPGLVPAIGMMLGGSALSVRLLTFRNLSARINGGILLLLFLGMLAFNIYMLSR